MTYAIWFLVKLSALITLLVVLASQEGAAQLKWMFGGDEYQIDLTLGVFAGACLILLALILVIYRAILSVVFYFKSYGLRKSFKRLKYAQNNAMKALSELASGDYKRARKYADRARGLSPNDHTALADFVSGVVAKSSGDVVLASEEFTKLAYHKETHALGMNALTGLSLGKQQIDRAIRISEKALSYNPKQKWFVRKLYQLYIQQRIWDKADEMRHLSFKLKMIDKEENKFNKIALLHAKSIDARQSGQFEDAVVFLKQAYKLDKTCLPVALDLLSIHMKKGDKKRARKLIEDVWPAHQHPNFMKAWAALIPEKHKKETAKYTGWYERLLALKPDSHYGQIIVAKAAIHEKMYGQARAYLQTAEKLRESKELYDVYADLEIAQHQDHEASQKWLRKALKAPEDEAWVCVHTGVTYAEWSLFTDVVEGASQSNDKSAQYFYSLVWMSPSDFGHSAKDKDIEQRQDMTPSPLLDGLNIAA